MRAAHGASLTAPAVARPRAAPREAPNEPAHLASPSLELELELPPTCEATRFGAPRGAVAHAEHEASERVEVVDSSRELDVGVDADGREPKHRGGGVFWHESCAFLSNPMTRARV